MENGKISARKRIGLWAIAWLAAAAATVAPAFGILAYGWMFPVGLLGLFDSSEKRSPGSGDVMLVTGWVLYIVLSIYGLTRKDRIRYYVAYSILLGLLILNVAGCRVQMSHMKFPG